MKKQIVVIIMILIILTSMVMSKDTMAYKIDDSNIVAYYHNYIIDCNINIDTYLGIFSKLENTDYLITNIKIDNNYEEKIKEEISNIEIEKGSYINGLKSYLNKYIKVLDKYDLENEIAKIQNHNINIIEISVYTTIDGYSEIYNKIKKGI